MAAANRATAALDRLARLHPKLIDLGLDRSFALLEKLGSPHHHLPPTIHVGGTNVLPSFSYRYTTAVSTVA